jgi:hypothetical protein
MNSDFWLYTPGDGLTTNELSLNGERLISWWKSSSLFESEPKLSYCLPLIIYFMSFVGLYAPGDGFLSIGNKLWLFSTFDSND